MRVIRWFTLALVVALPSAVFAQPNEGSENMPPETTPDPERQAQPPTEESPESPPPPTRQPQAQKEDEGTTKDVSPDEDMKGRHTERDTARVKSYVIPAVVGIEAADNAIVAVHELGGTEDFDRQDGKAAVKFARDGIDMALEHARSLDKLTLSRDAKTEASNAIEKLQEARNSLMQIEKSFGTKSMRMTQTQIEDVRTRTKELHGTLEEAKGSVEKVAKEYKVSTDLDLEG